MTELVFALGKQKARRDFFLGNIYYECIKILGLRMPVTDDVVITFDAHIVPIDIPLLLGLEFLRKLRLLVNFDNCTFVST